MRFGLPVATVRRSVPVPLRFPDGYTTTCRAHTFTGLVDGREHIALGLGDRAAPAPPATASAESAAPPLVRPHSECLTGDVFGSQRCDCGGQLREAVERIAGAGGYLLYLRQEGRGIGLYAKLDAYAPAGPRARHLRGQPRPRPRARTSATTPSPRRCCTRSACTRSGC